MSNWNSFVQSGNLQEIDTMGSQLSIRLDCPVHYPAFNKNLFECSCGITIPYFMVKGAIVTGDWSLVERKHKEVGR